MLAGAGAASAVVVGRRAEASTGGQYPVQVVAETAEVGAEPTAFNYPDDGSPCFVVALAEPAENGVGPKGNIVAFSTLCPHLGCPIDRVDAEGGRLGPCRCHFSCFDISRSGAQLQGQSTQDLAQVVLEERDGLLYAVGMNGLVFGRLDNLK